MKRRKVLAGLGSLAAAGAAATGTSAFYQVQAKRNVTVEVEDDTDGYLGLEATSAYASNNNQDGKLSLSFSGANGLNPDAVTGFNDLFRITNNGTNTIIVYFDTGRPDAPTEGPTGTFHDKLANLLNVSETGLTAGGGRGANYGFYRSDLSDPGQNFDHPKWHPVNLTNVDGSYEMALPPGTSVDVGWWITVPPGVNIDDPVTGSIAIWAYDQDIADQY